MNFFKEHKNNIVLFLLLFVITTLAFALGYLSAKETEISPIIIEQNINSETGI